MDDAANLACAFAVEDRECVVCGFACVDDDWFSEIARDTNEASECGALNVSW